MWAASEIRRMNGDRFLRLDGKAGNLYPSDRFGLRADLSAALEDQ